MKIINKIFVGLLLLGNLCSYTMEQPGALTKNDSDLLNKFLVSQSYKNPIFIAGRSDADLKKVITISYNIMNNPRELENLNNYMRTFSKKFDIGKILNGIVDAATQELTRRKLDIPQKICPAPALQPKVVEPKQISAGSKIALKKIIQAEIIGEIDYLNTRSNFTLESAIDLVNKILNNQPELIILQKELSISEKELKKILERVRQKASSALERAQEKETPKIIPAPQQILPEAIKAPIALAEQPEAEIRPNKLYIGLDIQELNSNGQRIRWETPINGMNTRIGNARFEPNDYFHITLAWYETKKAIDPAIVAKFERALAHATEILKIVFPKGVHGISLLDGAVLLGQNAVAFRVAESADLKKMQDIFLKFLSFENIEGIKYNTFTKENPIHVTLGKIWPPKIAAQFQNNISNLSAPDGARASQGQSFTINTFRLTYTVAGQAWQEKMSYKF